MSQLVRRPDGRVFVSLRNVAPSEVEAVLAHAVALNDRVYVNCDLDDARLYAQCENAGMQAEFVSTLFRVPFTGALGRCSPRDATGYVIDPADQVDPDALFDLDIQLRQDVPGTNGWIGNREWFDDELASDDFDPSGYLVASDQGTGDLVGLVRFWHRPDGPRLGLLGVLASHRSGFVANALFRHGLMGASGWGFAHFVASTARPALQRRMLRCGGVETGRFAQMASQIV